MIAKHNYRLRAVIPKALRAVLLEMAAEDHRSMSNLVCAILTEAAVRRIGSSRAEAAALLKAQRLQEYGPS